MKVDKEKLREKLDKKRYDQFGHLSPVSRIEHFKEFMGVATEYEDIVKEERDLLGLDDWYVEPRLAEGEGLEEMRDMGWIASISAKPKLKRATIWLDKERIENPKYSKREVFDHELAHLIISPYPQPRIRIRDGEYDTKAVHISRAMQMLRETPKQVKVGEEDNLEQIVDKAKKLTRLDVNNWRIKVEEKDKVEFEGERLPAFAQSHFYEDHRGWGLFSARAITLEVDKNLNRQEQSKAVLKSLWRVVFNPYGRPSMNRPTERKIDKVTKTCLRLGWREGEKNG